MTCTDQLVLNSIFLFSAFLMVMKFKWQMLLILKSIIIHLNSLGYIELSLSTSKLNYLFQLNVLIVVIFMC